MKNSYFPSLFQSRSRRFWASQPLTTRLSSILAGLLLLSSYLLAKPAPSTHRVIKPLLLADVTYSVQTSPFASQTFQNSRVFFDADNDGDPDYLFQTSNSLSAIGLRLNNGDGSFATAINANASGTFTSGPLNGITFSIGIVIGRQVVIDYDKDGDEDLYESFDSSAGRILRNNGNGSFTEITSPFASQTSGTARVFFDADNDGDRDILFQTDNSLSTIGLRLNNGNGTFAAAINANASGQFTSGPLNGITFGTAIANNRQIALDFDNDGDEDLYESFDNSAGRILRNNGNGTFTETTSPFVSQTSGSSRVFFDVDSDDDLDVLFQTGNTVSTIGLRLNNGDGSFATAINANASGTFTSGPLNGITFGVGINRPSPNNSGLHVVDYDNDGDPDLFDALINSTGRFLRQENPCGSSVYTVTNTNDTGPGSLRQAMLDVAATTCPGPFTISFNIAGSGVQTITPQSVLPILTKPVFIDGLTQPGATTAVGGLRIELNGTTAGATEEQTGLHLGTGSDGSTIRGLVINRFGEYGIFADGSSNHTIQTNYIGTDPTGMTRQGNGINGIRIRGNNVLIGGTTPGAGNVVSGNLSDNINLVGNDHRVQGNLVGTNATGTASLGTNVSGLRIEQVMNLLIGGSTPAARNLISGNFRPGILILSGPNSATVLGNYIGTDITGTSSLSNLVGIYISGNLTSTNSNTIVIGGTGPGEANRIAFNQQEGVILDDSRRTLTGVRIRGNQIFGNGALGIDLGNDGVTANDATDADGGVNLSQNFPVLGPLLPGATSVGGSLTSTQSSSFTIDVYANAVCGASGFGQGQTYLGSATVSTNGSGLATFSVTVPPLTNGQFITATATDVGGNTSEFSACQLVSDPTPTIVGFAANPNPVCAGSPLSFTVTVSNVVTPYSFTLSNGTSSTIGTANSTAFSQNLTASGNGPQTFTLTVNDGGPSATATTSVTVNAVTVSNPTVSTAIVSTAFSQSFTASGGVGPYNYSLASGSLPNGLTLNTTGVLSGTSTVDGSFLITVRATDANGCVGVGPTYTLTVNAPVVQCPTGDVTLTNQAQVDAFPPGCFVVPGTLTISGADITDLSPLASLTSVGATLLIQANPLLTSVSGLSALRQVGGNLGIYANNALPTLSGLESLTSVGVSLGIDDNPLLTNVSSLSGLRQVRGDLFIISNDALSTLSGLESLTSVGNNLNISANPLLTSVSSLSGLQQVGRNLTIFGNDALSTLSSLESLTSVGSNLNISGNPLLTSLSGLSELRQVRSTLTISSNTALSTLSGLGSLTSVEGLTIQNNPQLSLCATEPICRLLATLPADRKSISGNAPGCATLAEVEANCAGPTITGFAASPNPVCVGSPVSFTATVSNVVTPYSFTLTNGSSPLSGTANTTAFSQSLTASGSGIQTFTLTVSASGRSTTATTTVTVTAAPSATIAYAGSPFLTSSGPVNVSQTGTAGGTYSSRPTGLSLNTGTGQIVPANSSPGSYTVTYTLAAGGGCAAFSTTTSVGIQAPQIGASITSTKTVSGSFSPGSTVTYTITLTNTAAAGGTQANNPGNEFTDVLPSSLSLVAASASSGTAMANPGTRTVTWNGSITGGSSVTITITAVINSATSGQQISNQGTINYDNDGNGTNETSGLTDDPGTGAANDPTSFTVSCPTLIVNNPATATATVGQPFSQPFTASGGSGPYSYSVVSSNLPTSLSVSTVGVLSGTPTVAGSYSVLVQASDANGCVGTASMAYSLTVNPGAAPTLAGLSATPNPVCLGSVATFTATVGNATETYSYTLTNGAGTFITATSSSPVFSQSLTASGSGVQPFTLTVTSGGQSTTAITSLTVNGAAPTRLYVKANASGANTGLSWQDAFTDLQSALNYSCRQNLTEIWIARGIYKPTNTTARGISFQMLPDVAIYGGFNGDEMDLTQRPPITPDSPSSTTLSGEIGDPTSTADNSNAIIDNRIRLTSTAILDGAVITGPSSNSETGAIRNTSNPSFGSGDVCSPTIRNCLFINNGPVSSGGVYNVASGSTSVASPTLINCVFRNNRSRGTIDNLVISGGTASPLLINCLFADESQGSAVYNLISNGGQIRPQLVNCSFLNNSAGVVDGRILSGAGTIATILTNCVLFNNNGANPFPNQTAANTSVTVQNSLLEASVTGYIDGGNNLTTVASPFVSATDLRLLPCSPAIDAGLNSATGLMGITTDVAGNPRRFNNAGAPAGIVDMGAYEFQGTTLLTVTNPTVTTATQGVAFSQPFTASGGSGSFSFSLAGGTLPTGLTLTAGGVLSGTPTVEGNFPLTVRATDVLGCVGVGPTYNLTVTAPLGGQPSITGFAAVDNSVCVGSPVSFTASIGNVTGFYSFTLTDGVTTLANSTSMSAFSRSLTPTQTGPLTVTLIAGDNGFTSTATTTITVNALPNAGLVNNGPLTCSQTSVTLTASGGTSYSFSGGALQLGSSNRTTVSAAGSYSVSVTDANGCVSSASTTVTSTTAVVSVANPTTTAVAVNTPFSQSFVASGGVGPYSYSLASGSLPTGLSLSTAGVLSGTPSQGGSFTITVRARDANGCVGTSPAYVLTVSNATPTITGLAAIPSTVCAGSPVTFTATIGNVTGSYAYTLTSGSNSLTGVSSNPAFSQSLTASGSGEQTPTLTVESGSQQTMAVTNLTVNPLPMASILPPASTTLSCTSPSVSLTATGGATYRWEDNSTNAVRTISAAGTYSVTVTAASGCSATASTDVLSTTATVALTNPAVSTATVGVAFSQAFVASGGSAPYSYSLASGSLPPSLSLSSAGVLSGTPTEAGSYSVLVSARDQNGCVGTSPPYTLTIQPADLLVSLTASPQQLLTNQSATLTATVTGGTAPYGFTFSGPGTITPSGNSATVAALPAGVQTFTVTVTDATQPTALTRSATVSLTVSPANTAPTTTGLADQTATVGTAFSLVVATAFSDAETPDDLNLVATGLPDGLTLAGGRISGTPSMSGVSRVTITATDPASLSVSTGFTLTVGPADEQPAGPFAITAVTTISCTPLVPNRFAISFTPRYSGLTGQPVSFSVANELLPTTQPGPYTLQLYTDNPVITLRATQTGTPAEADFRYNWLEACRTMAGSNTPPRLVNALSSQTATVGQAFTYVIPDGTFTDEQTPLTLTLSARGVPAGLSFAGATLSGVASTTAGSPLSVTITATDPGGLSASTILTLVIKAATGTPPPTQPFALTGVTTLRCTPVADRINVVFVPQYAGLNGEAVAFEVLNELVATTDPAPYSLTLYRDNPRLRLRATQTGSAEPSTFEYDWLAACSQLGQTNTPPRVVSPLVSQTLVAGSAVSLALGNTFADQETPASLTLTAEGLPVGVQLTGTSLTGTVSQTGVSEVRVTATDPGGLSVSSSFRLTVTAPGSATVGEPAGFTISSVQTLGCQAVSAGQRRVSFSPQYGGLDGSPVSFSVANELLPTTAPGPYSLTLYTDNPVLTLIARQGNTVVSYRYEWLSACGSGSRRAAEEVPTALRVTVLGNPTAGEWVDVELAGVGSEPVRLVVSDERGHVLSEQGLSAGQGDGRHRVKLGSSGGVYLLRVSTPSRQQVVKLLKH
ncbi:DUF11 domain-containing protein [Fibrisoma montanum]|uniref:DUF11 domain-containing protein n=1 Tax=Fibrisoma montanum TaxID=2305895 RepID=A0A418LXD0_9BACT|nr:putative Ig domain-containing protein [Fibrisoma montanum]RIV17924.1 DUF11 domain-containing protein [Fibrisoma montanum]